MDWLHLSNKQAWNRAFSLTSCFWNKVGGTVFGGCALGIAPVTVYWLGTAASCKLLSFSVVWGWSDKGFVEP